MFTSSFVNISKYSSCYCSQASQLEGTSILLIGSFWSRALNPGFDWFKTTATSINAMLTVHSAEEFAVREDLLSYVTILPKKVNKNKERTTDYNQKH